MLSLCLIARNEEENLQDCLKSVQGIVDEVVLVDTGSTDETMAIAEAFGAKVFHFPWGGDFAAARNESLRQATGDWILVLDADESLEPKAKALLPALLESSAEAFALQVVNLTGRGEGRQCERITRLFRHRPSYQYEGRIHEQILPAIQRAGFESLPTDVRILHRGYLDAVVQKRGKLERNLELLSIQEKEEPDNPYLHFHLGQTYKKKRDERAIVHFQRALELLGEEIPAYGAALFTNLVEALLERGSFEQAVTIAERGKIHFPHHSDLRYALGRVNLAAGNLPEACQCFQECLSLPDSPFGSDPGTRSHLAWNAIGVCLERAGEYEGALEALEKAIDGSPPGEIESRINRGMILSKLGRFREGNEDLRAALQVEERPEIWQNLGANAWQQGDFEEARAAFERANALAPSPELALLLHHLEEKQASQKG